MTNHCLRRDRNGVRAALVGILTAEELTITRAAIEAADSSGRADIFATEELIAS